MQLTKVVQSKLGTSFHSSTSLTEITRKYFSSGLNDASLLSFISVPKQLHDNLLRNYRFGHLQSCWKYAGKYNSEAGSAVSIDCKRFYLSILQKQDLCLFLGKCLTYNLDRKTNTFHHVNYSNKRSFFANVLFKH